MAFARRTDRCDRQWRLFWPVRHGFGTRPPVSRGRRPLRHPSTVRGLAFSPDGKMLLTGCGTFGHIAASGEARLWDLASGRSVGPVMVHSDPVCAVAFSRGGQTLLTASMDGLVRQWDRVTGERLSSPLRHSYNVMAAALSPDSRTLLTGGGDFYREQRMTKLKGDDTPNPGGPTQEAAALWNLDTDTLLGGPWAHPDSVMAVALQPDGKGFATGCRDGHVRMWTLQASQPSHFQVLNGIIASAAFTPDGRYLIVGGDHSDRGTVSLLDVATGKIQDLLPRQGAFLGADTAGLINWLQGPGPLLAAALSRVVGSIRCVACSSDGRTAATTGSDGLVRLWDLTTGRSIGPPRRLGGATDTRVVFSPDGRTFVTSSKDGPVQVWESATGKPAGPPLVSSGSTSVAVFSPDGRVVATAGKAGIIELWDVATGRSCARFPKQASEIRALAFSHDGRTLLAGYKGYARARGHVPTGGIWDRLWSMARTSCGRRSSAGTALCSLRSPATNIEKWGWCGSGRPTAAGHVSAPCRTWWHSMPPPSTPTAV